MTLSIELYWSFRSPYSYLATERLWRLETERGLAIDVRPVYPLAVRVPGFFKSVNPLWVSYLLKDTARIAEMQGLPFGAPKPDPVVMDMATGDVPEEQPYIRRLTRLGLLAAEKGKGMPFLHHVSRLIWSGEVTWTEGSHLADAAARAGLDLEQMDNEAAARETDLEERLAANQDAQTEAGHWGVPLMVFKGEPFFGQDRIDALVWRLEQHGLAR